MEIKAIRLILSIDLELKRNDAEKIRGFLGHLFWDNPYAHQHREDGSLIYSYPCVQYKVIDKHCVLIGFNEGMEILKKTFLDLKALNLDGDWQEILSKSLDSYTICFSISTEPLQYSFLTPWLALNEKNYQIYQQLGGWQKKKELLEKILIGNLISISKSLGYTVPEPIKMKIEYLKETPATLKGVPMLGFLGTFSVNFALPDYWGIGKSVSRGFGTIKRIEKPV
ncbi:MAG: CRISPR-associated endonuclease Cas6 [bacterium]